MTELEGFHHQLIADVQGEADSLGLITVEAFFELVGDYLTEAGEVDEVHRAYFEGKDTYSLQVDGYGGDPRDSDGVLSLIICDFSLSDDVRTLNRKHIVPIQQRLIRFIESSRDSMFRERMEETSPGYGLADLISTTWKDVDKVKLVVITNASYSVKSDGDEIEDIGGKRATLSVWDLKRIKQFVNQGQARADLIIDFERDFGGGVPLLAASGGDDTLESYLAVIPGAQLADIYEKWGPRLLEANVRSFLQARGKVNRGIRDTIRDEPSMFFSYNNGLSATADKIEFRRTELGAELVKADNLQIVNGGQTTASLHSVRKLFPEQLKQVYVQMKLTIVPPDKAETVVPRISEYANSQNKVNAADFFSNHPFHIRIEELSRRVLSPAGQKGYRETKWFYERARGQYADARARRSQAERKKFDAEFPRTQLITKTDLAKLENTFSCLPYIVTLGAQKNFSVFAKDIGKKWAGEGAEFNDLWFKRLVAKAIIFKATENVVSGAEWYTTGGYRSQIVPYAIAKLVYDARERHLAVDLDAVWRRQGVSENMMAVLKMLTLEARGRIINPPNGIRNPSEWAKKEVCWKWLAGVELDYPKQINDILISADIVEQRDRAVRSENIVDQGVRAEIRVHKLGAVYWGNARDWARERGLLTPRELGILSVCAAIPDKLPTEKQCKAALTILHKIQEEGLV